MGMYTELIFGAALTASKLNAVDLTALKFLFGDSKEAPINLPDHPFFKCDRWQAITRCSSYYFAVRNTHRSMIEDDISKTINCSSRANLKNYSNEIELFLDWVKPFIEQGSGELEFYAIVTYEEAVAPTIYYLKNPE